MMTLFGTVLSGEHVLPHLKRYQKIHFIMDSGHV